MTLAVHGLAPFVRGSAFAVLCILVGAASLSACGQTMKPAHASEAPSSWGVEQMNMAIEQTNFVVRAGEGLCSGTLIDLERRLILTNAHCVEGAISMIERQVTDRKGFVHTMQVRRMEDMPVEQNRYDGFERVGTASYVSEIVAVDKKVDLALLRIKSPIPNTFAAPLLPEGDKIVRGELVYIVGNPGGNFDTLVTGVVSNMNRTFEFPWTGNEKLPMIQFSGGITGGNSGGSLWNAKGQLIGVPAAGRRDATFIGLAVPISVVKDFLRAQCFSVVAGSVDAVEPGVKDAACEDDRRKEGKPDNDK